MTDAPPRPTTILCYGDSNTWGYEPGTGRRYPRAVRWPGRLAQAMGNEAHLIEEGLNSRTTVHDDPLAPGRNGLAYLVPCLASHAPVDFVILMLGTNDLKGRFALSAHDIALGIGRLLNAIAASEAGPEGQAPDVLVVSPPPLGPLSDFSDFFAGGEAKSHDLAFRMREIALQYGHAFLDAGQHVRSCDIDGVHLSGEDHAILAEAILATCSEDPGSRADRRRAG